MTFNSFPRGKESTEVQISQNKGKESKNSYQKLKRSLQDNVFMCACPTVISSISCRSFHFPFPYFAKLVEVTRWKWEVMDGNIRRWVISKCRCQETSWIVGLPVSWHKHLLVTSWLPPTTFLFLLRASVSNAVFYSASLYSLLLCLMTAVNIVAIFSWLMIALAFYFLFSPCVLRIISSFSQVFL